MPKVTEVLSSDRKDAVFICDFSPPKAGNPEFLIDARHLDSDFICVAYNPGKSVRPDSVSAAYEIKRMTGREVIFNLSPRDMNKLALESRLLGANLLGLRNVLVVLGDRMTDRDGTTAVGDYTATQLIEAIGRLNQGLDFRGSQLRTACDFCIGAAIDLGQDTHRQAALTRRKVDAGADFFVSQPVFDISQVTRFLDVYAGLAGEALSRPVFWGLQILAAGGVLFSNVPDDLRRDLERGRDGVDIALETYALFAEAGIKDIYLVSPIMRGGARDYEAGGRFLAEVRMTSGG